MESKLPTLKQNVTKGLLGSAGSEYKNAFFMVKMSFPCLMRKLLVYVVLKKAYKDSTRVIEEWEIRVETIIQTRQVS